MKGPYFIILINNDQLNQDEWKRKKLLTTDSILTMN